MIRAITKLKEDDPDEIYTLVMDRMKTHPAREQSFCFHTHGELDKHRYTLAAMELRGPGELEVFQRRFTALELSFMSQLRKISGEERIARIKNSIRIATERTQRCLEDTTAVVKAQASELNRALDTIIGLERQRTEAGLPNWDLNALLKQRIKANKHNETEKRRYHANKRKKEATTGA